MWRRPMGMRNQWAIILAGGDGTRLQSMTRAITGDNRPKQFVPVIGRSTLLDQTRKRVALSHIEVAIDAVKVQPETVMLLGITPTAPETEYGWIEPEPSILATAEKSITRVRKFWEKPDLSLATSLMERGCLWNSFVMVGRVDALLKMTRAALPEMHDAFAAIKPTFETASEHTALGELYSRIDDTNFSHQVLAVRPEDLMVMKVADVGWSDLGEPNRVLSTLAQIGMQTQLARSAS